MKPPAKKATAFRTEAELVAWLEKHHATSAELWIRLFKVHAKHLGIGYREALDASLCWGWIDGVRYSLDDDSFIQRFTPRKPKSIWSTVNVKRFQELHAAKRVAPAGHAAFKKWDGKKAPYSFESRPKRLSPAYLKRLKANKAAWTFYSAQPPWYRRTVTFLVMSAKSAQARDRRFAQLLADSANGKRIKQLSYKKKPN